MGELPEQGPSLSERIRNELLLELRWSYIAIGVFLVTGFIANMLVPHGWTVWPVIFMASVVAVIHELTTRNELGVPILHAYMLFGVMMLFWVVGAVILRVVGPLMLLVILPLVCYCTRNNLRRLETLGVIAKRRRNGQCTHCGYETDPYGEFCENCGRDPGLKDYYVNPLRVGQRTDREIARARGALNPDTPNAVARKKEQALLNRRTNRHSTRRK